MRSRKGFTYFPSLSLLSSKVLPLHQVSTLQILAGCRVSLGLFPPPTQDKSIRSIVESYRKLVLRSRILHKLSRNHQFIECKVFMKHFFIIV